MSEGGLPGALAREQRRVRELRDVYLQLPDGVGVFGAQVLAEALTAAEQAMASGDVLEILRAYERLRDCE